MSGIPFKGLTAISVASSFLLAVYEGELSPYPRFAYIGTFLQLWTTLFSTWAFYMVMLYPRFFSPLRHLPSPEGGSWWNGQFSLISSQPTGKPMMDWINKIPNDGLIRYLGMLNIERVLVTSPKALSEVLTVRNYDFIKPSLVATGLGRILGVGVLLAEGEEHKMQRKNLMPAFAFRHIKNLYPTFWGKSKELAQAITEEVKKGGIGHENLSDEHKRADLVAEDAVIEIQEWASRATLDIIGVAGLGQDFGAIRDPNTLLNVTYRKIFKPSRAGQILGLLSLFLPGWVVSRIPVKQNGEVEAAAAIIRSTCRKLIRVKKDKLEKHQLQDIDILSVALESGGFAEENLIDQLMTFLAAGHETTATAITWAIYLLCRNADVQKKLRAEIRDKLPSLDQDEIVTNNQIDHMPYLTAVCNEVLRYFPPVPLTLRDAAHDTVLLGHAIPKGTRIMLVPWAINKSEALWGPDASKFDPERWLPSENSPHHGNGGAASNYSFLTFLHGPRSCIGSQFAKAEFACLVAALVGRFEFALNDEREMVEENLVIKGGVTAKPAKGLYVRVRIVEGW